MTARCLLPLLTGLCLAVLSGSAWSINRCVDADGAISYQDQPCPDGVASETIDVRTGAVVSPPLPEVGEGPEAGDESEDEAILALVSIQATFEGCALASEGFSERHGELLARWRQANVHQLARYGRSGRYHELFERGMQRMRLGAAGDSRSALAAFCEGQFIPQLVSTLGD